MEDVNRLFSTVRSWDQDFLKLDTFSVPPPPEVKRRLEANLLYFQANYAVVVSIIFLTMVVVKPLLLFLLVGIAAGAMTLLSRPEGTTVQVGGQALKKEQVLTIYWGVASLVLLFIAGRLLIASSGLCGLAVFGHAALHRAKTDAKEDRDASGV
jgi:hypothetical protein